MTAETKVRAFNAYSAYLASEDRNAKLWDALQRSLMLLGMECDRRKGLGEDVSAIEEFIARTKRENPS